MANNKWEKLKTWVTNAVNEGLARDADCQSGRDKGLYEAYKNVADKMRELDGENRQYEAGELVIYKNGDHCEIGKVKRVVADGVFVCYHEGSTASKTPFEHIYKLSNAHCVSDAALGVNI